MHPYHLRPLHSDKSCTARHRSLGIMNSVANGLHHTIIRPRRRASGDSHDEVHLRPEVDVISSFGQGRFDRKLARLAVDRNIHEAVEWRRDVVFRDSVSCECIGQVAKTAVVWFLIRVLSQERLFGAWCHDEVVPPNGVFDDGQEWIAPVAEQCVAGGQVDLAGVVEGASVRESLSNVGSVVGSDVRDLLALRIDDTEALALFEDEGRSSAWCQLYTAVFTGVAVFGHRGFQLEY